MIKITDKKYCTGCYACSNICPLQCITMQNDIEGFWYPEVDKGNCIDCGLCEKVCPILYKEQIQNQPQALACFNKDERIRLNSSSGGVFSLFAEQIIDMGGVVFGAGFDDNFAVLHSFVEIKDGLEKFQGSKYVQSRIGTTYREVKEFLVQGRLVLFTGTPCQIGGLKSYLDQSFENLFCIDIVCHGVPSPKVWHKYVMFRETCAGSPIRRIIFRLKNKSWKRYSVSFLFKNDTEYLEIFSKDLYMTAFLKDICLRPSCYACQYKTLHRQSDITLADFWGIQNILPEMDDDSGTSLLLVNSNKGHYFMEGIKNKISSREVDINQAVTYNTSAIRSAAIHPKRDMFFEQLDKKQIDELIKKYCTDSLVIRAKREIKSIAYKLLMDAGLLDTAKRILRRNK